MRVNLSYTSYCHHSLFPLSASFFCFKKGYGTNAYDGCSAAFGIRNIPNRGKALKEMARVTKPNGVVAVLEFSEPSEGLLAPVARLFVGHVVPRLG